MSRTDDGFAILLTANRLGLHTDEVLMDFKEWLAWCEAEGTDPEVMTFEHWIDEMRSLADDLRERDEEMRP